MADLALGWQSAVCAPCEARLVSRNCRVCVIARVEQNRQNAAAKRRQNAAQGASPG